MATVGVKGLKATNTYLLPIWDIWPSRCPYQAAAPLLVVS